MHLLIDKASLLKALFHQQSLIERRGPSPILSHVKIETQGEKGLTLTGTDLESTLKEDVEAKIIQEGSITVSAHMLYDVVRKMPEGLISLSHGEKKDYPYISDEHLNSDHSISSLSSPLKISGPDIDFSLPTLSSSEFPSTKSTGVYESFTLPVQTLSNLIGDTRFAMSAEETRYALNGIYFHSYGEQWRAVATDARLLALSWININTHPALGALPGFIVGRKAIGEINKLIEGKDGDVLLEVSKNHLILTIAHCSFSSRLIDGQFPDYNIALPQDNPYIMTLKVKPLEEGITRVSMVSFDKQRLIRFALSENSLILSACSPQYGSAVEKIVISYNDKPITLGFNPKHLLDICSHMNSDHIVLEMKNSTSPVLFRDPDNIHLRFVLMPLRIT